MKQEKSIVTTIVELEIDGVVYRVTAEFSDRIPFEQAVSEWAIDKVVNAIKKAA